MGRIFALTLAKNGYSLVLHYHKNKKALAPLKEELAAMGCSVIVRACDLTNPGERARFALRCFTAETEVLINSAACFSCGTMAETLAEDAADVFSLNTLAPYDLIALFAASRTEAPRGATDGGLERGASRTEAPRGATEGGLERGASRARLRSSGLVVNLLDSKIYRNASRYAAYTLSKKSLADITLLAAREFAPSLRVNAIAPGCLFPEGDSDRGMSGEGGWTRGAPLGNAGTAEDIGHALEFFVRAQSVTGQILCVDGGISLG